MCKMFKMIILSLFHSETIIKGYSLKLFMKVIHESYSLKSFNQVIQLKLSSHRFPFISFSAGGAFPNWEYFSFGLRVNNA